MTIQEFMKPRSFFASRAKARAYRSMHGGKIEEVGLFAWGSFGLRPTDGVGNHCGVIRVWAVCQEEVEKCTRPT